MESIQKRLTRERPPRVKITYDVETLGSAVKAELPFVMGIIADLSGNRGGDPVPPYDERDFVFITRDNFTDVMKSFAPTAKVTLPASADGNACTISFKCMDDFTPDNLVRNIPTLKTLLADRNKLRDYRSALDTNSPLLKAVTDYLSTSGKLDDAEEWEFLKHFSATDPDQVALHTYLKTNKATLSGLMTANGNSGNVLAVFASRIADEDKKIAESVDAILHDPEVQKLEAVWRGLFSLVSNTETGEFLKLRVLNASFKEISDDLSRATNFDQSRLFKKIYEETYGTLGGEPYSCLLLAHEFDHADANVQFLRRIMQVAAAAHAPLITAASPNLLALKSFTELSNPSSLADVIAKTDHTAWRSLRAEPDARYLNLVLPRVLMRMPYSGSAVEEFDYEESLGDKNNPAHANYLWGNAAFFLAQRITNAYALYHWTAAIRGVEGGGVVENLPAHTYVRASGDEVIKIPTETAITDRREKELSDLGFIALCYRVNTDKAAFLGAQSLHKPDEYQNPDATSNAALSARLPYLLNASRFAHYIKVKMRDKVGAFLDRESVETYLNNWISDYVLLVDTATQELKAQYPLREAQVTVTEVEGSPGSYSAIIHLRPHFQMEELLVSLRLVATLPAPAA